MRVLRGARTLEKRITYQGIPHIRVGIHDGLLPVIDIVAERQSTALEGIVLDVANLSADCVFSDARIVPMDEPLVACQKDGSGDRSARTKREKEERRHAHELMQHIRANKILRHPRRTHHTPQPGTAIRR